MTFERSNVKAFFLVVFFLFVFFDALKYNKLCDLGQSLSYSFLSGYLPSLQPQKSPTRPGKDASFVASCFGHKNTAKTIVKVTRFSEKVIKMATMLGRWWQRRRGDSLTLSVMGAVVRFCFVFKCSIFSFVVLTSTHLLLQPIQLPSGNFIPKL